MPHRILLLLLSWGMFAAVGQAEEKQVASLKSPPPADMLSAEVAETLASTGYKITAGEDTVAEVWLRKEWPIKSDFMPSANVLYPFKPGELIGVIRFEGRGEDFRNQQFRKGVYTIRYGQQPVDGNHVGTSDTLDFLLLLPGKKDSTVAPMDAFKMVQLSTEVSGSTHPAILSMLAVTDKDKPTPSVVHDSTRALWSLRVSAPAKAEGEAAPLPLEFVFEGHSPE